MAHHVSATFPSAFRILLVAALLAGAADADARRLRGSSGASSSRSTGSTTGSSTGQPSSAKVDSDKPDSDGFKPRLNFRGSSSRSGAQAVPGGGEDEDQAAAGNRVRPQTLRERQETARRIATASAASRADAEKAAAAKAAADLAETNRQAAEKADAERALLRTAEEQAEAVRMAAALEKKKREDALIAADVDRVLQRARSDYPVLKTAEGEFLLRKIMERQKALAESGMYPSVAMVQAISDHSYALEPPRQPQMEMVSASVGPAQASRGGAWKSFDGCRWASPIQWTCN